ncbi:hypothetical protein [Blastococcus saxobsidens]|uniref:Uncharacterized protein n=1 Tax=Blastococcus saxobsidens TaxID=138336 RepID=A0A4Q7Y3T1_9ACTN|nr:hypothetical protein [Blastococcus saxobsidens]RZU30663.1 hypothetical protein BKA19_0285 [Blastococcus saxobsidens]
MTTLDAQAEGRRRADHLLTNLSEGADDAADEFLAGLTDIRDLVFVGAALTAIARAEGRVLPTAQRAQASTRQLKLGQLRDSHRDDPEGLRTWLRRSGEEILFIRSLQAIVAQLP